MPRGRCCCSSTASFSTTHLLYGTNPLGEAPELGLFLRIAGMSSYRSALCELSVLAPSLAEAALEPAQEHSFRLSPSSLLHGSAEAWHVPCLGDGLRESFTMIVFPNSLRHGPCSSSSSSSSFEGLSPRQLIRKSVVNRSRGAAAGRLSSSSRHVPCSLDPAAEATGEAAQLLWRFESSEPRASDPAPDRTDVGDPLSCTKADLTGDSPPLLLPPPAFPSLRG